MTKKGRQWTWWLWESSKMRPWRGNYATASILAGMLFCALLAWAMVMRAVAPYPPTMYEHPILVAKRSAGHVLFSTIYMPECELAALGKIDEPYRSIARKTGYFASEAFEPAMSCLDERLAAAGLPSIEHSLRASPVYESLFSLICVGDLRAFEPCQRAFEMADSRGRRVAEALAAELSRRELPVSPERQRR